MEAESVNPDKGEKQKSHSKIEIHDKLKNKDPRPVFLIMISLVAFVFYGLISLVFLFALFLSGWISDVRNKYLPEGTESKKTIILITTAGFLLHMICLIGSINIWYRRKYGYLMLSISTLIITLFQLFSNSISLFTLAIYISFIILFGIYYRRFQ